MKHKRCLFLFLSLWSGFIINFEIEAFFRFGHGRGVRSFLPSGVRVAGKRFFSRLSRLKSLIKNPSRFLRSFTRPKNIFARIKSLGRKQLIKTGLLLSGTMGTAVVLKMTFDKWLEHQGLAQEVEGALSAKMLSYLTLNSIKKTLQEYTHGSIKDMNFALRQIVDALKQEKEAQKKKEIIAYHALPVEIFAALDLYTALEFAKRGERQPDDFFYVRTLDFDKEGISKKANNGLELYAQYFFPKQQQYGYPDYDYQRGLRYLMSFVPFLFQRHSPILGKRGAFQETSGIMSEIAESICILHDIKGDEREKAMSEIIFVLKGSLNTYEIIQDETFLLQFRFKKEGYSDFDDIKNSAKIGSLNLEKFYVGYDKRSISPDLYFAKMGGAPVLYGVEIFNKMLQISQRSAYLPRIFSYPKKANDLQLRLPITEAFLKQGPQKYNAYIVDVNKKKESYQHVKHELKKEIKSILEKYKK